MSVKDRVKEFAKYANISVSAFEKSILVANGYVNSISKSIGIDKIDLILEKYPKINIEWLLTGKGPMLKGEEVSPVPATEKLPDKNLEYIIDLQKDKIRQLERDIDQLKKDAEPKDYLSRVAEPSPKLGK